MQMAQNWLAAMGGKFQGDETCGCELKHSKWSGQIHYALDIKGDDGHNDLQEWSNHELSKTDVTVKDGFGAAQFYHDEKHMAVNRQRALRGGAITYIPNTSSGAEASGAGMSVASVEVEITPDQKNYTVSPTWIPVVIGKLHSYTCIRDTCTPGKDVDLGAGGMVTISGPLQDPNHLQGSSTDRKDNLGYSHKGVRIETIRWDLWRTAN
jgi:hypothetical protein